MRRTYAEMHKNQTVDFGRKMVRSKNSALLLPFAVRPMIRTYTTVLHFSLLFLPIQRAKYCGGKAKMTVMEAIFALNSLIDESDPDVRDTFLSLIISCRKTLVFICAFN